MLSPRVLSVERRDHPQAESGAIRPAATPPLRLWHTARVLGHGHHHAHFFHHAPQNLDESWGNFPTSLGSLALLRLALPVLPPPGYFIYITLHHSCVNCVLNRTDRYLTENMLNEGAHSTTEKKMVTPSSWRVAPR